jgi:uncharacterized protein
MDSAFLSDDRSDSRLFVGYLKFHSEFTVIIDVQMKKTLVLGASLKPFRYSHKAVLRLLDHNVPVVAVGKREGFIRDVKVLKPSHAFDNIHTISLYLGPRNQGLVTDYILRLNPVRVIFNPGTENPELQNRLAASGIEVVEKCMLVMLAKDQY